MFLIFTTKQRLPEGTVFYFFLQLLIFGEYLVILLDILLGTQVDFHRN